MRIAIVEDEQFAIEEIKYNINKYKEKHGGEYFVDEYINALNFLDGYRSDYDLVLFDVEMPMMNGIEAAKKLREQDVNVAICFITNMRKYAVSGYDVGAIGFIIKPIAYAVFETTFDRIIKNLNLAEEKTLSINSGGKITIVKTSHIKYIEVYKKKLTIHTVNGDIGAWGTLSELESRILGDGFFRCNSCYLVNFKYIDYIEKETVAIGEVKLSISHLRRKDFVNKFTSYLSSVGTTEVKGG